MPDTPIIVWFRRDLRVSDHAALSAAVAGAAPVVPVYIHDDKAAGAWPAGGASQWWLQGSLEALAHRLAERDATLILRRGPTVQELLRLAGETGAKTVHCSRAYEPWAARLEHQAREALEASGVTLKRFAGSLLHDPDTLLTLSGGPYKVYTPFWRALIKGADVGRPIGAPDRITSPKKAPQSDKLDNWKLLPRKPDWAAGLREAWTPGEAAAQERLATFVEQAVADYATQRDRPDLDGTSRLSPHLAFGEISPRQCWRAAEAKVARDGAATKGGETFMKELAWREFSAHLLFHFPELPSAPFRPEFAAFPWRQDKRGLRAWQRGMTGYPIVDAGMRQLWTTGWMHNRVRMIVASFLIKDLRIAWQDGEAWFWDTLVDADLANNAASWQWVAGSGADAAPYFRIFNPIKQGETFDPDGDYVRRWVPELKALPARYIHAPWDAPEEELRAAGVRLGKTYPTPVVDHAEARKAALAAYEALRAQA